MPHQPQRAALSGTPLMHDAWATHIVPRLPAGMEEQAVALGAFRRVRNIRCSADLLRAVLAYVLCAPSFRRLGMWAVLLDLADMSDTAWCKRLRAANAWLLWLLGELMAAPPPTEWPERTPCHRILLVDATVLQQPGGTGADWRVHLAYDLTAGRMQQVLVTDRFSGEYLTYYQLQPGDIVVADNGYGYRRSVAAAVQQQADVLLRTRPSAFPLETATGDAFDIVQWLRRTGQPQREWQGWCRWQGQRYAVRLIAVKLSAAATDAAQRRARRKAAFHYRKATDLTLEVAGWMLLITTLDVTRWPMVDVLWLYRARWQIELVFKRMKQLLQLNQIRSQQVVSAEATVRALLIAWALHEDVTQLLRTTLAIAGQTWYTPLSSWLLSGVSLDLLRHQVGGFWTVQQLYHCLARLHRFLDQRGGRLHQETAVRAWINHPAKRCGRLQEAHSGYKSTP